MDLPAGKNSFRTAQLFEVAQVKSWDHAKLATQPATKLSSTSQARAGTESAPLKELDGMTLVEIAPCNQQAYYTILWAELPQGTVCL